MVWHIMALTWYGKIRCERPLVLCQLKMHENEERKMKKKNNEEEKKLREKRKKNDMAWQDMV